MIFFHILYDSWLAVCLVGGYTSFSQLFLKGVGKAVVRHFEKYYVVESFHVCVNFVYISQLFKEWS